MALALDGQVHGTAAANTDVVVSLTTSNANDYIIVAVTGNAGREIASISGSTLGAFSQIANPPNENSIWAKFSSSALSSESITVTNPGGGTVLGVDAFGVSGSGQTSLVWDSGGPQTSTTAPISFTNATADCMLVAQFSTIIVSTPGAGTGFTAINGGGAQNTVTEYKILSSATTTSCSCSDDGLVYSGGVIGIPLAGGGGGDTLFVGGGIHFI